MIGQRILYKRCTEKLCWTGWGEWSSLMQEVKKGLTFLRLAVCDFFTKIQMSCENESCKNEVLDAGGLWMCTCFYVESYICICLVCFVRHLQVVNSQWHTTLPFVSVGQNEFRVRRSTKKSALYRWLIFFVKLGFFLCSHPILYSCQSVDGVVAKTVLRTGDLPSIGWIVARRNGI